MRAEGGFENLAPGGRIILHEKLLNDAKTGPFAIAAFSIAMLLWTEGEQYSGQELSTMLAEGASETSRRSRPVGTGAS
jgi:hypothetical protein